MSKYGEDKYGEDERDDTMPIGLGVLVFLVLFGLFLYISGIVK